MDVLLVRGSKTDSDADYCAVMRNTSPNRLGMLFLDADGRIIAKKQLMPSERVQDVLKCMRHVFLDQRTDKHLVRCPRIKTSTLDAAPIISKMRTYVSASEIREICRQGTNLCSIIGEQPFRGRCSATKNTEHRVVDIRTNTGICTKLATTFAHTPEWAKIVEAMHLSTNNVIQSAGPNESISSMHDKYISSLSSLLHMPTDTTKQFVPFRILHHTGFKAIETRETDKLAPADLVSINATFRSGRSGDVNFPIGYAEFCRPILINERAPATDLLGEAFDNLYHQTSRIHSTK